MTYVNSESDHVYATDDKGVLTRRWMAMVSALHQIGYGRLRLACSWEDAGPAPVWFGIVAPVTFFRRDHGATLVRHPISQIEISSQNEAPMFSSRWCLAIDYP